MTLTSAEPLLYSVNDDGEPILTGTLDSSGFVSFPYQQLGSLETGEFGPALTSIRLSGFGEIRATAAVWRSADPAVEVPYTVASIVFEEGPMVRAILSPGTPTAVGTAVVATTTVIPRADGDVSELRFKEVAL